MSLKNAIKPKNVQVTYSDIISDEEVNNLHVGNFGDTTNRQVIDESVLKVASGYWIGSTAQHILTSHRLLFVEKGELFLTKKGKEYLFHRFYHLAKPNRRVKT